MARLTLLLAFAVVLWGTPSPTPPAVAAPVPKGVKKKADVNGTWELVEFVSNGVTKDHSQMVKVWTLDGETFRIGPPEHGSVWSLTTPDPDKPTQRRFTPSGGGGGGYAAAIEADGDELRFCYVPSHTEPVHECAPGKSVMFYRFKRVGDVGK